MSAAATRVPRLDRGVRRSSRNRLKINFASPAVGTGACFLELGRRCRPRLRTSLRSASSASSALELFWRSISGDVGRARIDRRRPGGASCSRRALSDVVARTLVCMITRARYRARGATSASMSALLIRACDPHPLPSKLCLFSHPSTSVASLPRCSTAALRRAAARRRLAALNHNKPRRLHFR